MTRRDNQFLQQDFVMAYEHGALTADTTVKLFQVPSGKKLRIKRVTYNNPTGLAADAVNFFNLKVIKGVATLIANWSTETGQEGALPADDFVTFTLQSTTDEDNVIVGGAASDADLLQVFFDEDGIATLPAGRLVVEGTWVH